MGGEKYGARAGPENGALAAELAQRLDKIFLFEQLQHRGALAARNDQALDIPQIRGGAHYNSLRAGSLQCSLMRLEIPLRREYASTFPLTSLGFATIPTPATSRYRSRTSPSPAVR